MSFLIKLAASLAVIVASAQIGKRFPSLGGLIATMPLTTLIVFFWLYSDDPENYDRLLTYTRGVLWGILPSILFFMALLFCLSRRLPLSWALLAASLVWLAGAFVHQKLLG